MRPAYLLALALLFTTGAFAAAASGAPQRTFPVAAAPVPEDRFPEQAVVFPGGVKAWRDVTYQQLPGYIPQVVDIYVPATKGPHPLVIYIHGGGWVGGHTRQSASFENFPAVLASLAAEGFTVASLEYRLSGEAQFPAQLQDSNAALRFLRANAAKYRIDPKRVGVWGGSAGGHLTALTALTCRDVALDPAAANDACVQAAVSWYGVFDFAAMARSRPNEANTGKLVGCTGACSDERLGVASPVRYIDAKDPPFLLIHGDDDKVVPVAQSHAAEAKLRAAGVPVEAIYIAGVDHSFVGATREQTRDATLKAVNATFDFFLKRLGVARK